MACFTSVFILSRRFGRCAEVIMSSQYRSISAYQPPEFASNLAKTPSKRVKLATLPTPLHKWNLPGVPDDFQLYIKRDDLTGSFLSGNKIRKLEFLLADALDKGCGSVITCGSFQSNHCRATAVAAKELGLDCHLVLRSKNMEKENIKNPGNLLPSVLSGSQLYLIPLNSKYELDIRPRQEKLAKSIALTTGKPAYCIPVGGSNSTGVFGYIEAWNELISQEGFDKIDDIFVATGSGGTVAGLCIGNYLTGQKIKIHGISVSDDKYYFHSHVNEMLHKLNITGTRSEDLIDIIDGHKGEGYGKSTSDDHSFLQKMASTTGIFCDHVYSGKAVRGMLAEMKTNPSRFQGKNVMFIHTGGAFGLYDGVIQSCLDDTFGKLAHTWENKDSDPELIT